MLTVLLAACLASGAQVGYLWTFDELSAKADLVVIAETLDSIDVGKHDRPDAGGRAIPVIERRTGLKVLSVLKPDAGSSVAPASEIHLRHVRVDLEEFQRRNPAPAGQPQPGLLNAGTSFDFDSNPGSYLFFLKRLDDGDYEPVSALTFPTDSGYMLLPTARQEAWGPGDRLPVIAAELRAVQDEDMTTDQIPARARQLIPALRRELAARVERSLNVASGRPIAEVEAFVRADVDSALRAGISDAASGPYGRSVDVRLRAVPGAGDFVIAAIGIGNKCGDDISLHVFKGRPGGGVWWSSFATLASRPSASIGDAWGMLEYAAEADGRGGFLLAVADINPWCSSNWQALRYRVYRSTRFGVRAVFGDLRSIYIGGYGPVFTLGLQGRRLEFRFEAESPDEAGFTAQHHIVYEIGATGVTRVLETPARRRR